MTKLICTSSLAQTLDAVNEALFYERPLSKSQKTEVAKWIASRQGLPGSYADMFAPTEKDYKNGVVLFTGEKIVTRAGLSHVLGQEASRMLKQLDVKSSNIFNALERANQGFIEYFKKYADFAKGTYCCCPCSCALWRRLSVASLGNGEQILAKGMKTLKTFRDGKGRWKRFPFYYTLLALYDIDLPAARKELQYAAPACERIVRKAKKADKINKRRYVLAQRVLEKC